MVNLESIYNSLLRTILIEKLNGETLSIKKNKLKREWSFNLNTKLRDFI